MQRDGFTTLELMMVVLVVAILVVASLPDHSAAESQRGLNFSVKLESDIAYAQSMSVADPSDPMVLRVDTDANIYWLAKSSSPDTPITHPATGKPYVVTAGNSTTDGFQGVQIQEIEFGGDDTLVFDSLGGIDQDVPAKVRLTSGASGFEVELSATMGTIRTIAQNAGDLESMVASQSGNNGNSGNNGIGAEVSEAASGSESNSGGMSELVQSLLGG